MNVVDLLNHMRDLGIKLWAEEDRLRYSAPPGVWNTTLQTELAEHKAEILTLLRRAATTDGVYQRAEILPAPRGQILPLSFPQQRVWFFDQLQPGSPVYNVPLAFQLTGALNAAALEGSINDLILRHESLRTTFAVGLDGQPMQIIAPRQEISLKIFGLEHLPAERRIHEARRLVTEEARQPMNLATGPLLRPLLLRLNDAAHVLCLTIHHIISDGWSEGVLFRELSLLYRSRLNHIQAQLAPLPIQYADFALWQNQQIQSDAGDSSPLQDSIAYWKKKLGGGLPVLQLPADYPRPAVQTFRGALYSFSIPKAALDALKDLSRRENASLFMMLLAAFDVLLYRCTAQTDIIVGAPIANRAHPDTEGLIGFFANTLALRATISDHLSFQGWLAIVRQAALEAYDHQDVPFEKLVDLIHPDRSLSYSPVFQVMLVLEDARQFELELPGVTLQPWLVDAGISKFDLTLFVTESPAGLNCSFEYSADLFEAETIARMAGHWQCLLESILADASQPIGKLPMLTESERRQLLVEWNDTRVEYPQERCVQDLFEAQAERTPDAIAAVFEDRQLTYRELNRKANQLARYLQKRGVKPDALVGVYIERSLEMLIGLLGILKAGGAYVPIDPSYPSERQKYIIEDSGISILLTQESLYESVKFFAGDELICLDRDWSKIAEESDANPQRDVTSENLAYVIYTSGSTGLPKGAMIVHRGLTNYLNWCLRAYPVKQGQGSPVHSSLSFDLTVTSIYPALLCGQKVTLLPEKLGVESLESVMKKEMDFSLVKITPAHLILLNEQMNSVDVAGRTHAFIIGGEILYSEHVNFWLEHAPDTALVNEYGPTETTVGCCVYTIPAGTKPQGAIPIGRPIDNTQLYVLDEYMQPVPIGVAGELYIGGAGVARGYLNQPELTVQKFIPSPFSSNPEERLYKTGDRARWLSEGNLEFLGRLDFQVKIRGYRVELGEIESVLEQRPEVGQVVVADRADANGMKRLVAYLTVNAGAQNENPIAELRSYLQRHLPDYMIPGAFVVLDELPLTPNGKIDRKALPDPDGAALVSSVEFAPLQTPTEQILAGIWIDLLRLQRVGRYDNFFELGGHSLMATQALARLRGTLGVEVSVRTLFEAPTLIELGAAIDLARKQVSQLPPPMLAVERTGDLPLSFAQQRLWFHDQIEGPNSTYNLYLPLRLSGPLNAAALESALNEIVQRHEALRTTFPMSNGSPRQQIESALKIPLRLFDLQLFPADEQDQELKRLLTQEVEHFFDLAVGPLFRPALYRLGEKEHILLLNMHHIISDGWSLGILWNELAHLYQAFVNDVPASLPPLERQYVDFSVWQRAWLQEGVLAAQLAYWKDQLANAPTLLDLPTDYPRPPVQSFHGGVFSFEVDSDLFAAMKELSRRQGVSLFMLLYAVFAVLLSRYSGQEDIVIGTVIANRHYQSVEKLIGYFVNSLALRVNLSGQPTFAELLNRIRQLTLDAYAHQDAPFDQLVNELNIPRNLSHSPLFQIMLSLDNTGSKFGAMAELDVSAVNIERRSAKFDLTLEFTETGENLQASLEYNSDLFELATIERMAGHMQTLLAAVAADPRQPIVNLPLLTEAERRQIFGDWNDTRRDYPNKCFHLLFEEQVERTPDNIAVFFENERLTYRELNRRANQLAHHLRALGVEPEKIVGVCMERSVETLVSLLAIFKSGGVYVPLDPALPAERLDFMVSNSQAAVVLTKSAYESNLSSSTARIVQLDKARQTIAAHPQTNPENLSNPKNLAYIIYTSGSTGVPKGAMVEQQGMVNHLYAKIWDLNLTGNDRIAETAPQSFDISIWQFLSALLMGGSTYIFNDETSHSPADLLNRVEEESISILEIVPSLLHFVLDEARARGSAKPDLSALRWLLLTGEALPPQPCREWFVHYPNIPLMNAYGPTECSDDVTHYPIYKAPPLEMTTIPIGKAVTNMRLYILDAHKQPTPIGIPGELYVGGIGVGRGYLNNPERTAVSFSPDPFVPGPDARFYKTGDLVRRLPDGNIEFLGRIDHQVKIRGFRIELGEIESVLGQRPDVHEVVVVARTETGGQQRLVAYLTVDDEVRNRKDEFIPELRNYLKQKLPDYMAPGAFVLLGKFPLTPNGKVDHNALPQPDSTALVSAAEFAPPQTPTEQILADIWIDLLGLEQVGRYDNFFELGGDSIVSLQLINRAQSKGLYLTPRQVFEAQTIESLAQIAAQTRPIQAEQGLITGDAPLTPIQHWFFERHLVNPHHFNQSVLMEVERNVEIDFLTRAIARLLTHHDALRLRFESTEQGWRQWHSDTQSLDGLVRLVDLSSMSSSEQQSRLRAVNKELQASLNLFGGPLLRAALFDFGQSQPQKLIFAIHHLAVDFVSWQILISDLWTVYDQLAQGQPARLPAKGSSFKAWANWLAREAHQEKLNAELDYWLEIGNRPIQSLPVDFETGRNRVADSDKVEVFLSEAETQALLRDVPGVYHTQINDILLTALAQSFAAWTGSSALLIDLEGHGRESDALDISRTVGWFTSLFPVCLRLEGSDNGAAIKSIKEQLRRIPQKGMGYGILRYLNQESASQLAALPRSQVCFNYGGQLKTIAVHGLGDDTAEEEELDYLLNIGGILIDNRLALSWTYSKKLYKRETIEKLARRFIEALQGLIVHCQSPQSGGYTPSDFPLSALSQPQLDRLIGQGANVADIYPLSPLQSVMLTQSLNAPDSGIYFIQTVFQISGNLDAARFKRAWLQVVDGHTTLRTAFAWQDLTEPVQIVSSRVSLPWDEQDWRGMLPAEQADRLNQLLQDERRDGFDLTQAPLMRCILIRLEEDRYQFVWNRHHLLMDGWSYSILLQEALDLYENPALNLPSNRPYRDYISWLRQQDLRQAERFWQERLSGFTVPTALPKQKPGELNAVGPYGEESLLLTAELSAGLQAFVQQYRLTLNTLFQGAWALALNQYSGEQDVVFGVTVSGRSAPLVDIESRTGLFINALPLRIKMTPETPWVSWLQGIMREQINLEQYVYTPLKLLEARSEMPPNQPLFNSNMRFQNYPLKDVNERPKSNLKIVYFFGVDWWRYPLNLVVSPDLRVKLSITYNNRLFDAAVIHEVLQKLASVLSRFVNEKPDNDLKFFLRD